MTHPVYSANPARTTPEEQARQIAWQHAEEIAASRYGATFRVPASDKVRRYFVSLSWQTCECADHRHAGASCEHLIAAEIVNAKSRTCADCASWFLGRDLIEVTEDHESLTWFVGDLLCRLCAIAHGVL